MRDKFTEKDIEELARKKKNEYQRQWRKENRDKVRKYQENYWERQALKEMKAECRQ